MDLLQGGIANGFGGDLNARHRHAYTGRAWVPNVRVERIAEASHWVQADAPERVNQLMVDFLQPIRG